MGLFLTRTYLVGGLWSRVGRSCRGTMDGLSAIIRVLVLETLDTLY